MARVIVRHATGDGELRSRYLGLSGCYKHVSPGEAFLAGPLLAAELESDRREKFERLPPEMRDQRRTTTPPPEVDRTPPPARRFDPTAALVALHAVDMSRCAPSAVRIRVHARVTFDASGHVANVVFDRPGPLSPTTLERVTQRVSSVRVNPFDGEPVTAGVSFDVD